MKRVLSIQDLSCVGKCSQSVALPVLSAMGLECVCLPTALLSAHTVFDGFYCADLTAHFAPITAHWKKLGLKFQTIYSGFLGSSEQIELVERLISDFSLSEEKSLIVVDPVMADSGALYAGFSPDFPEKMKRLCRRADIITPNVTEACLLTGRQYRERHTESFARLLLEDLLGLGVGTAIVTGLRTEDGRMAVAAMSARGEYSFHATQYIPSVFHGTGDLFAATCTGALTLGLSQAKAISLAADYVLQTIRVTAKDPDARWYGVNFEQTLPDLISHLTFLEVSP